ncbi:hypothetical protein R1sor_000855 [Riccia sorocarpa]|uniref:Uncharacterized protein n=1 Tax=Riccia sorocarpa TaxID=122646 RepID=A0ABD3GUD3_9MARC
MAETSYSKTEDHGIEVKYLSYEVKGTAASSDLHRKELLSVSKQKEAASVDIAKAGAGAEDCNFEMPNLPPKSNAWVTKSLIAINKARRADNPYIDSVDPDWGSNIPDLDVQKI